MLKGEMSTTHTCIPNGCRYWWSRRAVPPSTHFTGSTTSRNGWERVLPVRLLLRVWLPSSPHSAGPTVAVRFSGSTARLPTCFIQMLLHCTGRKKKTMKVWRSWPLQQVWELSSDPRAFSLTQSRNRGRPKASLEQQLRGSPLSSSFHWFTPCGEQPQGYISWDCGCLRGSGGLHMQQGEEEATAGFQVLVTVKCWFSWQFWSLGVSFWLSIVSERWGLFSLWKRKTPFLFVAPCLLQGFMDSHVQTINTQFSKTLSNVFPQLSHLFYWYLSTWWQIKFSSWKRLSTWEGVGGVGWGGGSVPGMAWEWKREVAK